MVYKEKIPLALPVSFRNRLQLTTPISGMKWMSYGLPQKLSRRRTCGCRISSGAKTGFLGVDFMEYK
jgi:hypothetical protein